MKIVDVTTFEVRQKTRAEHLCDVGEPALAAKVLAAKDVVLTRTRCEKQQPGLWGVVMQKLRTLHPPQQRPLTRGDLPALPVISEGCLSPAMPFIHFANKGMVLLKAKDSVVQKFIDGEHLRRVRAVRAFRGRN